MGEWEIRSVWEADKRRMRGEMGNLLYGVTESEGIYDSIPLGSKCLASSLPCW